MQIPKYAQPGQPAQELNVQLELKVIADVGLVGFPNVGKSTFLSRVTNANPKIEDAPWPATKDELIDYAMRSGAPLEVIENLQEIEDEGEIYESIEDIWPDYPSKEDFFFNEEEY